MENEQKAGQKMTNNNKPDNVYVTHIDDYPLEDLKINKINKIKNGNR